MSRNVCFISGLIMAFKCSFFSKRVLELAIVVLKLWATEEEDIHNIDVVAPLCPKPSTRQNAPISSQPLLYIDVTSIPIMQFQNNFRFTIY